MSDINVIEVKELAKYYPEVRAVDRISFKVKKGQVVGFLGPNGAGKTTTLKMLTCFLPPTSGGATVAGHRISQDPISVRRSIGYLPEHNALYDEMRVEEYLRFRATLKGVPWRLRRKYVNEAMMLCRLETVRDRVIAQLSKGFRQRVGLADTLVHKPPILILDEPTVGLDPAQIIEVRGLIKKLAKDNTVLLSTHYLSEVEQICDHVIIIFKGKIVAADTLKELCKQPDGSTEDLETVFMRLIDKAEAERQGGEPPNRAQIEAEPPQERDENAAEEKQDETEAGQDATEEDETEAGQDATEEDETEAGQDATEEDETEAGQDATEEDETEASQATKNVKSKSGNGQAGEAEEDSERKTGSPNEEAGK
jgi:ABC-2 type transport system ATP-binding protein